MSLPSRWNFSSTVPLNFYQQQISVRLLRPMPIWCLHKDSINVTSILRDCVGGEAATTSVLIWTEGLFISGLSGSRALLSLCSGAEIYSMARGAVGDPGNNGWTLFEQGRLHTRPHCRSLRLGNTTDAFIAVLQLECERLGWSGGSHFFVFGSMKDIVVFLCNFPNLVQSLQGHQHAAGWFIVEYNTVALTCIILCGQCCWMTSFAATLITSNTTCKGVSCLRNKKVTSRKKIKIPHCFHSLLKQPQQPSLQISLDVIVTLWLEVTSTCFRPGTREHKKNKKNNLQTCCALFLDVVTYAQQQCTVQICVCQSFPPNPHSAWPYNTCACVKERGRRVGRHSLCTPSWGSWVEVWAANASSGWLLHLLPSRYQVRRFGRIHSKYLFQNKHHISMNQTSHNTAQTAS